LKLRKQTLKSSTKARKKVNKATFKQDLRQKFIQTCKSYIGIPYAKKYHKPDSELFKSPIFLDCCGLVRQSMKDLKHLFGFCIGSGNQAYQYDTLPLEISEEQAKPGDIIFYIGKYRPGKKFKRQKHDVVHVEVYLGEGKSIGSRWNAGTISVFDSFKFHSSNWELVKFSFRSLETWLEGTCVSHCKEHSWVSKTKCISVGKGSIFALEEEEAAAEEMDSDKEGQFAQQDAFLPFYQSIMKYVYIDGESSICKGLEDWFKKELKFKVLRQDQQDSSDFHIKYVEDILKVELNSSEQLSVKGFLPQKQILSIIPSLAILSDKLSLYQAWNKFASLESSQQESELNLIIHDFRHLTDLPGYVKFTQFLKSKLSTSFTDDVEIPE
jgi:hypothetical protein